MYFVIFEVTTQVSTRFRPYRLDWEVVGVYPRWSVYTDPFWDGVVAGDFEEKELRVKLFVCTNLSLSSRGHR